MKLFGFSLCLLLTVGVNTTYAQNTVDLVPIINKCHVEGYGLDSLQAIYLRNVPCNTDRDTIYVIEYYYIWAEKIISMYWSHGFRYLCVNGHENDTIYIER